MEILVLSLIVEKVDKLGLECLDFLLFDKWLNYVAGLLSFVLAISLF